MNETTPPSQTKNKSTLQLIVLFALIGFLGLGAFGIWSRMVEEKQLAKKTDSNAVPTVNVITAAPGNPIEEVVLPGTVQAWHEAIIYARTAGYLKSWNVDIGAHVKAGDILAEIDAPDLDAQYHQAQADVATAQANYEIAELTAKRYALLRKTDSIAEQTTDQALATAAADLATVNSQKANLDHLQQEEDFKKVIAPFDGVISQRNVDVGGLINGGSSAGQDLFHIAQTDKLRVYVQVPENDVSSIKPDLTAELHFPQSPQQIVTATLARTADSLDPSTRSLTIELEVDNTDNAVLAGSYTDAHIKLPTPKNVIMLPVNTLIFRDKLQVGVVRDNHVALTHITLGRDFGKTVEVVSGLSEGDQVMINPPDSLADGQEVRLAAVNQQQKK